LGGGVGGIGGGEDGIEDLAVAGAAAEVAAEGDADGLGVGGGAFGEQLGAGHQHAGDAVAALDGAVVDEGLLEGVEAVAGRQAFDRGDGSVVGLGGRDEARHDGLAVEPNGAGAALPFGAAFLGPGQAGVLAQGVKERLA